jgi:hypothetical protein
MDKHATSRDWQLQIKAWQGISGKDDLLQPATLHNIELWSNFLRITGPKAQFDLGWAEVHVVRI